MQNQQKRVRVSLESADPRQLNNQAQSQADSYYNKEKIQEAKKRYERMRAEYEDRGITYEISHYAKRIP